MCRLMYLPTNVRPPLEILTTWMEDLERSFGGHGNGLASIKYGYTKGVKLTCEVSARAICRNRQATVWHTRRISCGDHSDSLCHPFASGPREYLVHNGHWEDGAAIARQSPGLWSDTAIAALYIRKHGWEVFTRLAKCGVWLNLTTRGVQVHYASGELWAEKRTGALCSEPCDLWGKWERVVMGTYDAGEKVATVRPAPKPKRMSKQDMRLSIDRYGQLTFADMPPPRILR